MNRAARTFLVLTVTVIALICAMVLFNSGKPPFKVAFWYWHSPYQIPRKEAQRLAALKIHRVFVRAGTFTSDGTNVVLALPQTYQSKTGQDLHLVFNFDAGVIRHFESYDLERMSEQVAVRIDRQVESAKAQGERVEGIQLDFDVPTRLLNRYADLVRRVRAKLKNNDLLFSTTGLLSWLDSEKVLSLSQELDFMVPQAYEGFTGTAVNEARPVSDLLNFAKAMRKARGLRCPFYIGIPAYGHGLLYDQNGRLVSMYQNMGPAEAFRHPAFRFVSAYPVDSLGKRARNAAELSGEEMIRFRAVRPAPDGRGLGYTLVYTVPSPTLLSRMLKAAKDSQNENCLGAVIYRYPEPGSTLTLPFDAVAAVLEGRPAKPDLKISVDSARDNFDVIESSRPANDAPKDIFLKIENVGNAPTFISPDAVTLEIDLDVTGIDEVRLRDMDSVRIGVRTEDGSFRETSPNRARTIQITKVFLAAGEKAYIGPIRLLTSTSKKIEVRWIMRDSDGFQTYTGNPAAIPLESHSK